MGHMTLIMPIWGRFVIPRLTIDMLYLYSEYEDSSFSHFTDMKEDPRHKQVLSSS